MGISKLSTLLLLAGALGVCLAPVVLADGGPNQGREWSSVNTKKGNASPSATRTTTATTTGVGGPSTTTTTTSGSNIDEYTHQDEQVNIDGGKSAIVKVLRVNQKNLVNDFVVDLFPIKNASPIEIREALRTVTYAEGGRAEVIRDKEKKEYFLFVVAPTYVMPYIKAAVEALDEEWVADNVDGSANGYYKAKFRDIDQVGAFAKVPAAMGTESDDEENLLTRDNVANAAHIQGEPYRVKSFLKYAPEIDQPVPQAMCKITVYEVDVSNEKKLGLDYMAWKNGPGRSLFNFVWWGMDAEQRARKAGIDSGLEPFGIGSGKAQGSYYSLNYLLSAEYLDFLEGSGRARTVASGKILAKNGVEGQFAALDEVLQFQVVGQDGAVQGAETVGSSNIPLYGREVHRRKDHDNDSETDVVVGLEMKIKPFIAEEITELRIAYTSGDFVNSQQVTGVMPDGSLVVRQHDFSTTVLVRDGQPICVGGIRRTEDVKQTQKIPFLGDIPVLGYFFGHEHTVKREKSMVIVIEPTIRFGTEADLMMADAEDQLIRRQVERVVDLKLPKTEYGFDQWLLDSSRD